MMRLCNSRERRLGWKRLLHRNHHHLGVDLPNQVSRSGRTVIAGE